MNTTMHHIDVADVNYVTFHKNGPSTTFGESVMAHSSRNAKRSIKYWGGKNLIQKSIDDAEVLRVTTIVNNLIKQNAPLNVSMSNFLDSQYHWVFDVPNGPSYSVTVLKR